MASPEVCKALPMIVWSISSGLTPVASSAPRAATAPRSIAEMSFSAPTYSPIGVRLPPSMKTSLLMCTSPVTNYGPNRNLEDYHKPQRGTKRSSHKRHKKHKKNSDSAFGLLCQLRHRQLSML